MMVASAVSSSNHLFLNAEKLHSLLATLRSSSLPTGIDETQPRDARRQGGIFFTPAALVEFVSSIVINMSDRERPLWRDGWPRIRILDSSAGDGRFLAEVASQLVSMGPSELSREVRHSRAQSVCVAVERNPRLAEHIRVHLPDVQVVCADALIEVDDLIELGRFNVIVGNPPYVRSVNLSKNDPDLHQSLRGRFSATSYGEWDLYTAFIERTMDWLTDDGVAGLIVPSRWLTARSATTLRANVVEQRALLAVVDFGAEQLFAQATTYSSVVFLGGKRRAGRNSSVEVARFRGGVLSVGEIDGGSLGSAPWRLAVGQVKKSVAAMRRGRCGPRMTLGELARIAKGTGTNADKVFVLSEQDPQIESARTRVCIRGRDVVAFGKPANPNRLLYPYCSDASNGSVVTLIEPATLRRESPLAYGYLEANRTVLEARERGRFRGDRFYQYGRPQNLRLWDSDEPILVVPDVASRSRAMRLAKHDVVLDSAYAIVPHQADLVDFLLAILNSSIVTFWLRETGILLRGGYLRMKTAYLRELPIPDPDLALSMKIAEAAKAVGCGAASSHELEQLVQSAYGVNLCGC